METVYVRINWQNQPSTATALGATNLNKIDLALSIIDGRVVSINTTKLDVSVANTLVQDVTVDGNGVFTIKKLDGSTTKYDTKLEKIAVNFTYDTATQQIVITLDDGTKQYVDLSSLITEYEFTDSSTIGFTVTDGKVSASVKNGSIKETHLQPNYLADIKVQAQNAQNSANASADSASLAKRYSIGIDAATEKDSAKYFMEQAKIARDQAVDISNVGISGKDKLGLVSANGNVDVDSTDGAMWADAYKDKGTAVGTFINFLNADDALAQVNIKGATTVVPTNPDLPISPDNKATLVSAQNFDLVSCKGVNLVRTKSTGSTTNNGITLSYKDGYFIIDGTPTSNTGFTSFSNILDVFLIKGVQYTSSLKNKVLGTGIQVVSNAIYNFPMSDNSTTKKTGICTSDTGLYTMVINVDNTKTYSNVEFKPQIEFGSVENSYSPYKEDRINIPYELGEWNDIKDGSYVNGAVEVIYDGSSDENWFVGSTNTTGKNRFRVYPKVLPIPVVDNNEVAKILCDKFKTISANASYLVTSNNSGIAIDNRNSIYIYYEPINGYTIEQFRAWLALNPIKVRYKIATPTVTSINTYLKTFKGVTNIFTNATPQVELTATFKPQLWADLYNHQNAINSKIDDKKRVNNLLSTDPTTVLSGAMGKLLQENIDAISTNLNKQTDVLVDCNNPTALTCFCNGTTLNTPYKQGLTASSEGRLFSIRASGSWNQELFLVNGGNEIFLRYVTDGSWMPWTSVNSGLATDWISGVDVKTFLTNNLTKVKFHLFSTGCTNVPNGWNWFAVIQLHTRAFAFSPFDSITKTAFTSYENGVWTDWQTNDLKSVTYTGITESYATPNGKYAYLALPVAKDSAKNLLVNVVNDEYIVHATYHNAYNWLALITKVDDSVPLSTSLTVNYTLIN